MAGATAVQKLRPSRLSDQLETYSDVDLESLNLAVHDRASFPLLERVVASNVQRTIEGASTVTLTVEDADRVLLRSGYIGKGHDIELDGLWFRLWSWSGPTDDELTLTFIDREVAVLKDWPPTTQPKTWLRTWPAGKFGLQTRFRFMKALIDDVSQILPIRFVCPALGDEALVGAPNPAPNPSHGFPAKNDVMVKTVKADATQLKSLDAVLQAGDELGARRKVLIAAVAVVTQESSARPSATNGVHVGVFQQDPNFWPATRDPFTDAIAFFNAAISDDTKNPNTPIAQLGDDVQLSGHPEYYDQWVPQATHTVDVWLGNTDTTTPAGAIVDTSAPDPTKGQFMRGRLESPSAAQRKRKAYIVATQQQGNKVVVREDNWACLTRLAQEIGFRCYCVSGTVYIVDDYKLFHQRVAMTLSEDTDGVDSISADFTQGVQTAKLTVVCRANRWQVPPGGVAAVEGMGPQASGRWLMSQSSRSLDDPTTTITLQKPVVSIPESAAPEHGAGQTSGAQVYTPPTDPAKDQSPGGPADQSAKARVAIADQLLKQYGIGWFDDNGKGLAQIQTTAGDAKLNGAEGPVYLDTRTMRVVLWLIAQGFTIGTFAWCSDHSDDGPRGHAGGRAVDISSINGVGINSFTARELTLQVATLLHDLTGALAPRQVISGGYGYQYDPVIAAECVPNPATFDYVDSSGRNVLRQEHTNHIHVGY